MGGRRADMGGGGGGQGGWCVMHGTINHLHATCFTMPAVLIRSGKPDIMSTY